MIENINITLILLAGLTAMASPGPATLAIASASVSSGRKHGLALAAGVTSGSILWSTAAALGLGTIMATNVWVFEMLRYIGAAYLLFLAIKSAKSAISSTTQVITPSDQSTRRNAFAKGLALHLTNPKAVLFFGALYALGIPPTASSKSLFMVICALALLAATIFFGYALLFSYSALASRYVKLRRWFETIFAIAFGAAAIKLFTTKLS